MPQLTPGPPPHPPKLLLLNNSRKLMCLTTQYCSTLSTSASGRRIIRLCEVDASSSSISSSSFGPDAELGDDEFDETVAGNYMDEDDIKEREEGKEEEEEQGGQTPTLFNGIIRWGFTELLPSYQIEKVRGWGRAEGGGGREGGEGKCVMKAFIMRKQCTFAPLDDGRREVYCRRAAHTTDRSCHLANTFASRAKFPP